MDCNSQVRDPSYDPGGGGYGSMGQENQTRANNISTQGQPTEEREGDDQSLGRGCQS